MTFCVTMAVECPACDGNRRVTQCDVRGGKWSEPCVRCASRGSITASVDLDTIPDAEREAWLASRGARLASSGRSTSAPAAQPTPGATDSRPHPGVEATDPAEAPTATPAPPASTPTPAGSRDDASIRFSLIEL